MASTETTKGPPPKAPSENRTTRKAQMMRNGSMICFKSSRRRKSKRDLLLTSDLGQQIRIRAHSIRRTLNLGDNTTITNPRAKARARVTRIAIRMATLPSRGKETEGPALETRATAGTKAQAEGACRTISPTAAVRTSPHILTITTQTNTGAEMTRAPRIKVGETITRATITRISTIRGTQVATTTIGSKATLAITQMELEETATTETKAKEGVRSLTTMEAAITITTMVATCKESRMVQASGTTKIRWATTQVAATTTITIVETIITTMATINQQMNMDRATPISRMATIPTTHKLLGAIIEMQSPIIKTTKIIAKATKAPQAAWEMQDLIKCSIKHLKTQERSRIS